jgi:hypothetical protein
MVVSPPSDHLRGCDESASGLMSQEELCGCGGCALCVDAGYVSVAGGRVASAYEWQCVYGASCGCGVGGAYALRACGGCERGVCGVCGGGVCGGGVCGVCATNPSSYAICLSLAGRQRHLLGRCHRPHVRQLRVGCAIVGWACREGRLL